MMQALKKIALHLPSGVRRKLKCWYYPFLLRRLSEEKWTGSAVVKTLLKPGDHVVDVGANIGYVTMFLSRWVGSSGKVFSLEPVPETFDVLFGNIRRLGLNNVEAICCAASSRDGDGSIKVPDHNYYESRITTEAGIPIKLKKLDTLFTNHTERISFIKIDVEGHEEEAIRGAQEVLQRWKPALFIEVAGNPDDVDSSAGRLFAWLAQYGYQAYIAGKGSFRQRAKGEYDVDYLFLCGSSTGINSPLFQSDDGIKR